MGKLGPLVVVALLLIGCPSADVETPAEPDAGAPADSGSEPVDDADAGTLAPFADGVQTLAGADQAGNESGPRNVARFNNPVNVAVGSTGELYVADFDNSLIRVVDPDGYVSTLTEQEGFSRPFGLTFAADGTLYVQTDRDDMGGGGTDKGTIWKVDTTTGAAAVVARAVGRPRGLLALPDGRLLMSDIKRHDVRILDPESGVISALAGVADEPGFADGSGAEARFNRPYDAVLASDGSVLIADMDNHRIRRLTMAGEVTTFAGTGIAGATAGAALSAAFNAPCALAIDDAGVVYVTDTGSYLVRAISPGGQVTTIAGDGAAGFHDGPPLEARFFGLEGLDVTGDGSLLYVADGNRGSDELYHRVRRVTLDP